jgi:hypothetical protein
MTGPVGESRDHLAKAVLPESRKTQPPDQRLLSPRVQSISSIPRSAYPMSAVAGLPAGSFAILVLLADSVSVFFCAILTSTLIAWSLLDKFSLGQPLAARLP